MESSTNREQEGTMSAHYHVATGLAGYGPDAADTDGFATFDTLSEALDSAREELSAFIDMAHEEAHAAADDGDFEQAWEGIVRMESLELLRANLDPSRKQAPLYVDNDAAYAALQETQAAEFPHDVSHNTRLYLWECNEQDCDDDDDDTAAHCGSWTAENHLDRGSIDCGCGWGAYCEFSAEYVGPERRGIADRIALREELTPTAAAADAYNGKTDGLREALEILSGTPGYNTR